MYRVFPDDDLAEPIATPVEVQQTHLELVERSRALEVEAVAEDNQSGDLAAALAQLREDVAVFESHLSATGARMPEGARRSLAQGILDFWALRQTDFSALALRLEPELQAMSWPESPTAKALASYDESTAIAAAAQAERCYQALNSEARQAAARSGFLAVLKARHPLTSDEVAALDAFVDAGVVCRSEPNAEGGGYVLVHEALPQAWDRLAQWQQEAAEIESDLQRVRESARAWEKTGNSGELPRGAAVDAIEELAKQDPSLDIYAKAARKQRTRELGTIWLVVGVLGVLALYAVYITYTSRESEPIATSSEAAAPGNPMPKTEPAAPGEIEAAQDEAKAQVVAPDESKDGDTAAGSRGWIWLGSNVIPSISLPDGSIVDLATLEQGSKIRTRSPLKIRESMPEDGDTNRAGRRIGQVSNGVTIELLTKPAYVTVKGIDQYWANVRVIPVVYIQLARNAQVPLEDLKRAMASAGYQVEGEERLPRIATTGNGLPFDVRYYYEQDQQAASDIAAIVLSTLGNRRASAKDALLALDGSRLADRVKTGTIEIWLYQR